MKAKGEVDAEHVLKTSNRTFVSDKAEKSHPRSTAGAPHTLSPTDIQRVCVWGEDSLDDRAWKP